MPDSTRGKVDKGTLLGILLAAFGIIGGLLLEKGALSDISQGTAAIIVLGGTFGAVLIGTPIRDVMAALRDLRYVVFQPLDSSQAVLDQIVAFATKARRSGIISLEEQAEAIEDPFLKRAMDLAIDGTDLSELRTMLQADIAVEERTRLKRIKVFENAAGYAPTIGIIGAVMGLIQVMKNIANIEEVGRGIAVAFVATIYGVGSANVLFLPFAHKIRNHMRRRLEMMEFVVEGVEGIVVGMNPKMLRRKLENLAGAEQRPSAEPVPSPAQSPSSVRVNP